VKQFPNAYSSQESEVLYEAQSELANYRPCTGRRTDGWYRPRGSGPPSSLAPRAIVDTSTVNSNVVLAKTLKGVHHSAKSFQGTPSGVKFKAHSGSIKTFKTKPGPIHTFKGTPKQFYKVHKVQPSFKKFHGRRWHHGGSWYYWAPWVGTYILLDSYDACYSECRDHGHSVKYCTNLCEE
jgi:hypothetical protein